MTITTRAGIPIHQMINQITTHPPGNGKHMLFCKRRLNFEFALYICRASLLQEDKPSLQSISPTKHTLDGFIGPIRRLIPEIEYDRNENNAHQEECLHANSSIHSRFIVRRILSSEDSAIHERFPKDQIENPYLPTIPPRAPDPMFNAEATFRLDDPTTLFCWNVMIAGVLH